MVYIYGKRKIKWVGGRPVYYFEREELTREQYFAKKAKHEVKRQEQIKAGKIKPRDEITTPEKEQKVIKDGYVPVSPGVAKKLGLITKKEHEKAVKEETIYYIKKTPEIAEKPKEKTAALTYDPTKETYGFTKVRTTTGIRTITPTTTKREAYSVEHPERIPAMPRTYPRTIEKRADFDYFETKAQAVREWWDRRVAGILGLVPPKTPRKPSEEAIETGKGIVRGLVKFPGTAAAAVISAPAEIRKTIQQPGTLEELKIPFIPTPKEVKEQKMVAQATGRKFAMIGESAGAFAGSIIVSSAIGKGIEYLRWRKARPETAFKEVITKPTGKVKESIGIAETKFMGKKYPSIFKTKYKTTPVTETITKGKGVTGIITKTPEGKIKTIAGTKFVTKDVSKSLSAQVSLSKYISQVGNKVRKSMEAGKFLVKKIKPDFFATLGETLTVKKIQGVVGGLTKVKQPTTSPGYTFIPATKVTTGATLSKIIGQTVKQTAKPTISKPTTAVAVPSYPKTETKVEKWQPYAEAPAELVELGAYPSTRVVAPGEPKVTKQQEAYFSRVGTILPKYELEQRVIRRKRELTEPMMRGLTFQAIKQAQRQIAKTTQKAMQQMPEKTMGITRISAPVTKQVEAQKMVSLQRALQFQAQQQRAIQRVISPKVPGRVFPPRVPGRVITIPGYIGGVSFPGLMGKRGRLPGWWRYWERHWPVATRPEELAKIFGWHPETKKKKRKRK